MLAQLPEDLQPVFAVAYLTGWRVKSELLTRQWAHVDFQSGWLRLEPGRDQERGGPPVPAHPRPAGRAGAPARAHPGGRESHAHDHPVAVPPVGPADQVLPPGLADGLYGRRPGRAASRTTSAGPPSGTSSGRACPGPRP